MNDGNDAAGRRATTGIPGLDRLLGGGFPVNRVYLIEGEPGTGKTTLSLQFLLAGARRGEQGFYVTLPETGEELRDVCSVRRGSASEKSSGTSRACSPATWYSPARRAR